MSENRTVYLAGAYLPNGDVEIECPEFNKRALFKADGAEALFARSIRPFVDGVLAPLLDMPGGFIDLKIAFADGETSWVEPL